MTLPRAMCQMVTLVRPMPGLGPEDAYGVGPDGADHLIDVSGCSLQPLMGTASTENLGVDFDQVTTRWRLFAPPGTDLGSNDRVQQGADPFGGVNASNAAVLDLQVDGDPVMWPGADGRPHHLEAMLKEWSG